MIPRRAALSLALLSASACTADPGIPSPDWDLTRIGAAVVPVPHQWSHVASTSEIWTELWLDKKGDWRLLAGRIPWKSDAEQMREYARQPLRVAATGFAVTPLGTVELDSGALRYSEQLTTTVTGTEEGRLWLLTNSEEAVAVALLGKKMNQQLIEGLERALTMDAPSEAPALREGWGRQTVGELSLAVPLNWRWLGKVQGSDRWLASWADADADGTARARLLVAPAMEQRSILDAIVRIESDSKAGALPGYTRTEIREPFSSAGNGARVDFTYGQERWQGVFWTVMVGENAAVALLAFSGPTDEEVVAGVEESIWQRQ